MGRQSCRMTGTLKEIVQIEQLDQFVGNGLEYHMEVGSGEYGKIVNAKLGDSPFRTPQKGKEKRFLTQPVRKVTSRFCPQFVTKIFLT